MTQGGNGELSIFFASGRGSHTWAEHACSAIASVEAIPKIYVGADANLRDSNIDQEIRDDFYSSRVAVIFFETGFSHELSDNWAFRELKWAYRHNVRLLLYAAQNVRPEELEELDIPASVLIVRSGMEFEEILRTDLQRLIGFAA